ISGRTVRSDWPLSAATFRRNGSTPAYPLLSAARLGLPATESRLTLSAILPRSASLSAFTYCADPVSAHSSTLKNITRRPRRQRTRDGELRGKPAAIVHRRFGQVMAVDVGRQHDPFVGRAGIVVDKRLGLGRRLVGLDGHGDGWPTLGAAGELGRRLGRDAEG